MRAAERLRVALSEFGINGFHHMVNLGDRTVSLKDMKGNGAFAFVNGLNVFIMRQRPLKKKRSVT